MALGRLGAGFGRMGAQGRRGIKGPTTTWNPADKNAALTLSNGNLTFAGTAAGNYVGVRTVASASSGKKYWEIHADAIATPFIGSLAQGLANASASLSNYPGATTNGVGWAGDGNVYINNVAVGGIQAWAAGNTLCFAVDLTAQKIWFRTNGGNWNNAAIGSQNPATGTGGISIAGLAAGPYFPMAIIFNTGDIFTANFGGSAYAQAAPSGFGNW